MSAAVTSKTCLKKLLAITGVLDIICLVIVLYFSYHFVRKAKIHPSKKGLFYGAIVVSVLTVLSLIAAHIFHFYQCFLTYTVLAIFLIIDVASLGVQYQVILWLLLYRLDVTFASSVYALTRNRKVVLYGLYVAEILLMALVMVNSIISYSWSSLQFVTTVVLAATMITIHSTMVISFTYRLKSITENTMKSSQGATNLLYAANKALILTVFSSLSSCIVLSSLVFRKFVWERNPGGMLDVMHESLVTLDTFSNFLSIFLGLSVFDNQYSVVCSHCQSVLMARAENAVILATAETHAILSSEKI